MRGARISLRDRNAGAEAIGALFSDKKIEIVYSPIPQEDPDRRCPDISKAKSLLDKWQPQISLRDGLIKMKDWYEKEFC